MTFSACAQSVQRKGALAISRAGTSPDSDGIDGAEMSSAPGLDLLDQVAFLAKLLGREDLDGDLALGALADVVGELLEEIGGDLAVVVGMAEAQRGGGGGSRRNGREGGETTRRASWRAIRGR